MGRLSRLPVCFNVSGDKMDNKKLFRLSLITLASIFLIWGCSKKSASINIAGSTTVLPIVQAAAEDYMEKNPGVNISVRGGGSGIGIKSAISRTIDIGNASRQIMKQELELLEQKEIELRETAIARDAISIVVHPQNPIENLTLQQLKKIYAGEITNWREVGSWDKKIIVIARDFSSGSFIIFNEIVLDSTKVKRNSLRLPSNNAVVTNVGYTPGAIGYIGLGYVTDNVKIVAVDSVLPDHATIHKGDYKLTRLLYMYTSDSAADSTQDFINFILSDEGQQIVESQGYLRLK